MRFDRPIGGFPELLLPAGTPPRHSVVTLWRLDLRRDLFLCNARSALARLLTARRARRVWLPAYVCEAVIEGVAASQAEIGFYALGQLLEPDSDFLARNLRRGDFVLAVDYFGKIPGLRFRRLVAARRDVNWVEDRAQAIALGAPGWGDWELFSPRKVLGVPDGGILAARRGTPVRAAPARAEADILLMLAAQAMRLADPRCRNNRAWYALFRKSEAMQSVSDAPMSTVTHRLLDATDPRPLVKRSAGNYRVLGNGLRHLAFFPNPPGPAPMGFPIRVSDAARAQEALARTGVFAQRHWARLPSPRRAFPEAHRLSRELLTLPCDYRYGEHEMRTLVKIVRECVR